MPTVSAEVSLWQQAGQMFACLVLAAFAENAIFSHALGVSRLLKLIPDRRIGIWQFCLPLLLVQLFAAPLAWCGQNLLLLPLSGVLPAWLPVGAFRPVVFVSCALLAMGAVWLVLGLLGPVRSTAFRGQLSAATCNCSVLGTLLICANQSYTLLQCIGFGLGSGLGYLFAAFIAQEGSRRLRSKAVPGIFQGLPASLIYLGILSMAIYGLVGTAMA